MGLLEQPKHIILCDTREQKRLEFAHPEIGFTRMHKLDVGDYCIRFTDGHIPPVVFERKSIGDLFGTLTGGYDRFKSEIIRSQEFRITLILIIEGSFTKILKGYKHFNPRNPSKKVCVDGLRVVRTLFSLFVRYGVIPVFCRDREEMQNYIVEYYLAIWRKREASNLEKK